MAIFAIGDIHGRADLLRAALSNIIKRSTTDDKIVIIGDIIDRGPETKDCIELILQVQEKREVIAIKGNHEEWMLETMNDYTKHSWIIGMEGLDTIKSYSETAENEIRKELTKYGREIIFHSRRISYDKFFKSIPNEHLDFLMNMKDYHAEGDYVFVHAGISVHEEDMNKMDPRKMRWGFDGFPEEYKGSRKIVYGHFSRMAILKNNKAVPYIKNKTICIDTSKLNVLTIFISPSDKIVQIGRPIRQSLGGV